MKNKWLFCVLLSASLPVKASEIDMNTGQFQAMDKITGRVSVIEIPVGGEISFGSFSIVLRDCKTRSAEEIPENFAFVDVADKSFDNEQYNIFKGWMFSSSPAVNAVEHPIYDVWLLKCLNTEVKQEQLLSEAALKERDNLPRLNEVVALNEELKQNTFITADDTQNISFKDEMYKEEVKPQEKTLAPKEDGEPQNLLNIDENYMSEDETVDLSDADFAKALQEESEKLYLQNTDIETLENEVKEKIDDSLNEKIDAELENGTFN